MAGWILQITSPPNISLLAKTPPPRTESYPLGFKDTPSHLPSHAQPTPGNMYLRTQHRSPDLAALLFIFEQETC